MSDAKTSKSRQAPSKKAVGKTVPRDASVLPSKTGEERELFLTAVSREVRKARERAAMTVSDLHRETGISRTVLQGYESGKFVPGSLELKKLCQVLRVTPNRILFGEEKPLERKPLLLASFVGDVTRATGTAKLAIVLQNLSSEELAALLSLVESIVVSRVGGAKKLEEMLRAVDQVVGIGDTPEYFKKWEEFYNSLPEKNQAMYRALVEEQTPKK